MIAATEFQLTIARSITHGHWCIIGIHQKIDGCKSWKVIADGEFYEQVTDAIPNEVLVKNKIVPAHR